MKRYSTTSIRAYAPAEDPNGEWVRYEDAAKRIAELEKSVQNWRKDCHNIKNAYDLCCNDRGNLNQRIAELESLAAEYRRTGEQFMRDNAALKAENERLSESEKYWKEMRERCL